MRLLLCLFFMLASVLPVHATIQVCNRFASNFDRLCTVTGDCPDADAGDAGTGDCETVAGVELAICDRWASNMGQTCVNDGVGESTDCPDLIGTDDGTGGCGVPLRTTTNYGWPSVTFRWPSRASNPGSLNFMHHDQTFRQNVDAKVKELETSTGAACTSTLSACVTAQGATPGTITVASPILVGADTAWPSTARLRIVGEGSVNCESDASRLTGLPIPEAAPDKAIFLNCGTGTMSFAASARGTLHAAWWGCLNDDSTDNAACYAAAGAVATNRRLVFLAGNYRSSIPLTLTGTGTELVCEGDANLKFTAATDGVQFTGTFYHQKISGCVLWALNASNGVALNIGDGTNTINAFTSKDVSVWASGTGKWTVGFQLRKVQSSTIAGGFLHCNVGAGCTDAISIEDLSRAVTFVNVSITGHANGTTTQRGVKSTGAAEWHWYGGTVQGGFAIAGFDIDGSASLARVDINGAHVEQTSGAGVGYRYDNSTGHLVINDSVSGTISVAPVATTYGAKIIGGLVKNTIFGSGTRAAEFAPTQLDTTLTDNSGGNVNIGNYRITGNTAAAPAIQNSIDYSAPAVITIADDGAGTSPSSTYTPAEGLARVSCLDANGCTLVLGETGMRNGQRVTIVNSNTNIVTIADTAGVTELNSVHTLEMWDSLVLRYIIDRWVKEGNGLSGLTTGTIPKAASANTFVNSAVVEDADSVNFSKPIETTGAADNARGLIVQDNSTTCPDPASGSTALCAIGGEWYGRDTAGTARELLSTAGGDYGDFTCAAGTCALDVGGGGGDFSSNTATSVDSEVVIFSGTAGKTGKRATGSGLALLTSGVLSTVTAPAGAVVGSSDTQTLTNKTLDAEGTGNVLTTVTKIWLPVAGCQNVTAGLLWDTETTNSPAAACLTGTNTQKGVADFDATTDECLQYAIQLPLDFAGAIDARYVWLSTATTGAAGWCSQLVSSADAETDDPAFPAQGAGNCVSDTAKGTTNQLNHADDTGITATGVAAGEFLHIRLCRDANGDAVTDDLAADARLVGVEYTMRRAQ